MANDSSSEQSHKPGKPTQPKDGQHFETVPPPEVTPSPGPSPADGSAGKVRPASVPSGIIFLQAGTRPLPEYELIQRLGSGGFGEVWKAIGPGGFPVALKFIRLDQKADSVELRSLELMKDIRHPHLLEMLGAWQADTYLIIAMGLGDKTLLKRLQEVIAEGRPG